MSECQNCSPWYSCDECNQKFAERQAMTHDNVTDIVERLGWHHEHPVTGALVLRNHDGPEAADTIATLRKQLENAREVITEANNSLYGSQGYFLSLDGGPPNKYHLAEGIEKLKSNAKALRAIPVSDGWEDIATAPKDGTLVLLFEPHSEGGFAFVGCNNLGAEWFNNLDMKEQNPTHWKHLGPLPAPPTIE